MKHSRRSSSPCDGRDESVATPKKWADRSEDRSVQGHDSSSGTSRYRSLCTDLSYAGSRGFRLDARWPNKKARDGHPGPFTIGSGHRNVLGGCSPSCEMMRSSQPGDSVSLATASMTARRSRANDRAVFPPTDHVRAYPQSGIRHASSLCLVLRCIAENSLLCNSA